MLLSSAPVHDPVPDFNFQSPLCDTDHVSFGYIGITGLLTCQGLKRVCFVLRIAMTIQQILTCGTVTGGDTVFSLRKGCFDELPQQ